MFSTQQTVNDHHFKASILDQQRQTSLHDLYDEEIICCQFQLPTSHLFRFIPSSPPKTNQLSSSCRSDQKLIISYIFNMWTLGARLIDGGLILSHWKHVLTSSYDRCIKEGLKGTLIRHGDHFSLKISHRHSRYYSSQVRRLNHFDIIIIVSERCASAFVLVDV